MDKLNNLKALIIIAQLNNLMLNPEQLIHTYAIQEDLDEDKMLYVSKKVGLKASLCRCNANNISKAKLPALVKINNQYKILAKINGEECLVLDPNESKPQKMILDDIFDRPTITIILVINKKHRNRQIKFGFKWFIPSVMLSDELLPI